MSSVFGKIIRGEIPAKKLLDNEHLIAIHDIHPLAKIHILIIPKKEIPNLQAVTSEDLHLIGEVVTAAQKLAKEFNIADGYKLMVNNGSKAGQTIEHLHFHLLGGEKLHLPGMP